MGTPSMFVSFRYAPSPRWRCCPTDILPARRGGQVAVEPEHYPGWSAVHLLDDDPQRRRAPRALGNVIVFELPYLSTISAFEMDTGAIDTTGRGPRIVVEIPPASATRGSCRCCGRPCRTRRTTSASRPWRRSRGDRAADHPQQPR